MPKKYKQTSSTRPVRRTTLPLETIISGRVTDSSASYRSPSRKVLARLQNLGTWELIVPPLSKPINFRVSFFSIYGMVLIYIAENRFYESRTTKTFPFYQLETRPIWKMKDKCRSKRLRTERSNGMSRMLKLRPKLGLMWIR